jgi:hypothetical protein
MERRPFLAALGAGLAGPMAGCETGGQDGTGSQGNTEATTTTATVTPPADDPMLLRVSTGLPHSKTGQVTVSTDEPTLLDETAVIEGDGRAGFDPGITAVAIEE